MNWSHELEKDKPIIVRLPLSPGVTTPSFQSVLDCLGPLLNLGSIIFDSNPFDARFNIPWQLVNDEMERIVDSDIDSGVKLLDDNTTFMDGWFAKKYMRYIAYDTLAAFVFEFNKADKNSIYELKWPLFFRCYDASYTDIYTYRADFVEALSFVWDFEEISWPGNLSTALIGKRGEKLIDVIVGHQ